MIQSEAHDFSPVECLEKAKPNLDLNLQEFQQLQSATVTFGQGGEVKSDEVHPNSWLSVLQSWSNVCLFVSFFVCGVLDLQRSRDYRWDWIWRGVYDRTTGIATKTILFLSTFLHKKIQECKENIEAFCSEACMICAKKLISSHNPRRTPDVVKKIEQVKMV